MPAAARPILAARDISAAAPRRGGVLGPLADGEAHGSAYAGGAAHHSARSPDRAAGAPMRPADQRGMGLRVLRYRADLAGGALEIRPGAQGGPVVTCTVPLRGPGLHASDL